jgi:hypothetical protein
LEGPVTGRAAIRRVDEAWFAAFPDGSQVSEVVLIDDERVAEIAMLLGTDTSGFLGLPPTGKPFGCPSSDCSRLDTDTLSMRYVCPSYDFTGMLVQIGVLKPKPA